MSQHNDPQPWPDQDYYELEDDYEPVRPPKCSFCKFATVQANGMCHRCREQFEERMADFDLAPPNPPDAIPEPF